MKTALCLQGIFSGTNDRGVIIDSKVAIESFVENIIKKNNADVFIHTWSFQNEKELNFFYNPKKMIAEPYKNYTSIYDKLNFYNELTPHLRTKLHSIFSRFYSNKISIQLKEKYEKENGFIYDCVMVARFDLVFYVPFIIEDYSMNYFYVSNWDQNKNGVGFQDAWFFSSSDKMDMFGMTYDNLMFYLEKDTEYHNKLFATNENMEARIGGHCLCRNHIEKFCKREEIMYLGSEYETWSLTRKIHTKRHPFWKSKNNVLIPLRMVEDND